MLCVQKTPLATSHQVCSSCGWITSPAAQGCKLNIYMALLITIEKFVFDILGSITQELRAFSEMGRTSVNLRNEALGLAENFNMTLIRKTIP